MRSRGHPRPIDALSGPGLIAPALAVVLRTEPARASFPYVSDFSRLADGVNPNERGPRDETEVVSSRGPVKSGGYEPFEGAIACQGGRT